MADLYTPTDNASKALDQLGVSAYKSNGEAKDFNDLVDELNGSLQGMTAEQKNNALATIFTTQGLQAFNKMTASSVRLYKNSGREYRILPAPRHSRRLHS